MEDAKTPTPEQESQSEEKAKNMWQIEKESWYDKLPVTFEQMDLIVKLCWLAIILLILVIALDAMDIFNPFGY